jgi:AbrB family looped-hinge helix DNA binding protein
MSKVTSKLQVTLPKALAERYSLKPGDEIQWETAADTIRVIPPGRVGYNAEQRLALFDQASLRQRRREQSHPASKPGGKTRGWTRDDLYTRGRSH